MSTYLSLADQINAEVALRTATFRENQLLTRNRIIEEANGSYYSSLNVGGTAMSTQYLYEAYFPVAMLFTNIVLRAPRNTIGSTPNLMLPATTPTNIPVAQQNIIVIMTPRVPLFVRENGVYASGDVNTIFISNNWQNYLVGATAVLSWGTYGSAVGQFNYPYGVAVSPDGSVFLADASNNRIQKFDSSGVFLLAWGTVGTAVGQFDLPCGVSVSSIDGSVFVADASNNRIQKFTSSGVFLLAWGTYGSAVGQFDSPRGVAVSPDGSVFVVDTYNSRIQKFTSSGVFLLAWGTYGSAVGQFDYPYGVAVSPDGSVFVADTFNSRIQKFDSSGVFLLTWGTYVGTDTGQFNLPYGVAVSPDGSVFVVDTFNNRIQKFDSSGVFLLAWGTVGTAVGQFNYPRGASVSSIDDSVFVVDTNNNRIQKFTVSNTTGTVLVLNTVDTATHTWLHFSPRTFSCTFTQDTSIAYLDIRDSNLNTICRIQNIISGVIYNINIDRPIHQLYFVPDALSVSKALSISNITLDNVVIADTVVSAASPDLNKSGIFINSDGTPGNNISYSGIYFDNGVMYGFTGLVPDGLLLFRVMLMGRVIGYVTSNTATTVTTSLIGYTDLTPKAYSFSPNIGRMPLAFAMANEAVYAYTQKTLIHDASIHEYTAPPLPFKTGVSLIEHTSSSITTQRASNSKQRLGIRKERLI